LLLQGPSSRFYAYLADALEARGAAVRRILLCPGDGVFWRRPAARYRGRADRWPAYLRRYLGAEGVTDIVLLGDQRPLHRAAIAVAQARGVRVHSVELGYLRPHWLTLEPDGSGGASRFPRDPEAIRALATAPLGPDPAWRSSFAAYAAMDVACNMANVLAGRLLYPHYRHYAIWSPLAEYSGWLWKALRGPAERRRALRATAHCLAGDGPLFLLPLQLRTDFQIRAHGAGEGLRATVRRVIRSFASFAPPDARLLIKEHPMDNGLTPWRRLVAAQADALGVGGQVVVVDGGDLDTMIAASAGVVTINSTVGLTALASGKPVKALGRAIYDVAGMTDRQPLENFWRRPSPPEAGLVADFIAALRATTQVRGAFDGEGARPGADAVAERLLADPPPFPAAAAMVRRINPRAGRELCGLPALASLSGDEAAPKTPSTGGRAT
jgi:capsular polysaccharide export protein